MPIDSPRPDGTRSELADWLEVSSLTGPNRGVGRAELFGLPDANRDDTRTIETDPETEELLETDILGSEASEISGDIFEELLFRARTLANGYPFALSGREPHWLLRPHAATTSDGKTTSAQAVYKFCLLASAIRDGIIHGAAAEKLAAGIPRLFQAVATEAAADVLGGESISFGWPRPDGTAFVPALQNLTARMGMGALAAETPLWSRGREKDAGVDIIAWRGFADGRPGKLVLFGQVASGRNWPDKSVKVDIPRFLSWFSKPPAKHCIPAIFIPFPQHHACAGRRDTAFDMVAAAEAWLREQEVGLVIDRMRIVGAAARRLATRDDGNTLGELYMWIELALDAAGTGAAEAD